MTSAEPAAQRIYTFQWSLQWSFQWLSSPRLSDLMPLDVLLSHRFGSTMDVLTSVLDKYTSVIQKIDAAELMQQRPYRKESEANSKRKNDKKGKKGGT
jgi:hypothetical protein